MRLVHKILFVAALIVPLSVGSCKKQEKCGCDGDALNTLEGVQVRIYYNEENLSASFVATFDPYSTYYFCNPTPMMEKLTRFTSGDVVLVDFKYFWECNYVYQASSSYYGAMYKKYMAEVFDIREDLYGN